MTHIVSPSRYKSKKDFKLAVASNPEKVWLDDPDMFNPVSGNVKTVIAQKGSITVTNHPKRSWFACVKRNASGQLIVS